MPLTIIVDHPSDEMYASGKDLDCQCARCGSSCDWVDCYHCEDGYIDRHDEDPLWYGHELHTCCECKGFVGWNVCCCNAEWCKSHPLPGREAVQRGQLEWFVIDNGKGET